MSSSIKKRFVVMCGVVQSRWLCLLLFCCSLPVQALAETSKEVYEGEAVVSFKATAAYLNGSGDPESQLLRHFKSKNIGRGTFVAKPKVAALGAGEYESRIVAHTAVSDPCQTDPDLVEGQKAGIINCSPNYVMKIEGNPNDPSFSSLWGMKGTYGIKAPEAWDVTTGSPAVVVAVIDTGIDYTHPDLVENMWVNPGETAGNGVDDDGNGYIDDVYGINTINGTGNPMDNNGHGTHVSGTIGARGNNGVGVVGVNWDVRLMGIKFLNANGQGSLADAVEGLNYVIAMKNRGVNVKITNNSWGGGDYSQILKDAIDAANSAGILFVAAAGNDGTDNDAVQHYPSGYDASNIISVAAIDSTGNLAYFSNYGATTVDIAAPGDSILSTTPGNTYSTYSGTSMATPHVSGVIALMLSVFPSLTHLEAKTQLLEAGTELPSLTSVIYSKRTANVYNAVTNTRNPLPPEPTPPDPFSYSIQPTVSFDPPNMAGADIVVQADEYGYYSYALPFAFPFYGNYVSSMTISPNGIVYFDRTPSGMDYQNGTIPTNSIAVVHSDLRTEDPYGVGVKVLSTGQVAVHWSAHLYNPSQPGTIDAYLVLGSDGVFTTYYQYSTTSLATYISNNATFGSAGAYSSHYDEYTGAIDNYSGLTFSPLGALPATGTYSLAVSTTLKNGKQVGKVISGKPFNLAVGVENAGSLASSTVSLSVKIDNFACGSVYTGTITSSTNFKSKLSGDAKALTFSLKSSATQGALASKKVKIQSTGTRSSSSPSKTEYKAMCQKIKRAFKVG